uniref:non-specific serine/threonine protein kinase n=1 Tax=Davidia involucrata TaxID=16924 RepID=A0A5B7BCE9_DAVIN
MREVWRLYRMSGSFAAIVGGAGGALAVLAMVVGFVWFCMLQRRSFSNKNSETGSSDPSAVVEMKRGGGPSSSSAPALSEPHGTRQFTIEELEQATKHFNESKLIGYGSFGLVYKGFLCDGTVVAIKRRTGVPRQELVEEVVHLSGIWHRNLVTLLGYCQERGYQMLVFEHLPSGSMCNHLYDTGKDSTTKLEFKQRLTIALGAAKGLCHLHSQKPPIVHSNFKTANVLVDENFIAKVADAGVMKLLQRIEDATPSHTTSSNVFRDPEVGPMGLFSEMSDVYSFGVFLLELVTGREASHIDSLGYNGSILQWVQTHLSSNDFVDHRLAGSFIAEGMDDFIRLTLQCMSYPGKQRPKMEMVVLEIDRILEKEITLTTVMGEGTDIVLGSQLFTSK